MNRNQLHTSIPKHLEIAFVIGCTVAMMILFFMAFEGVR